MARSARRSTQGGTELWAELHKEDDQADLTALIVEASRVKDRLDQLDMALSTGGIVDLIAARDSCGEVVEIRVDNALAEARQQANALRLLLNDIAKRRGVGGGEEDDGLVDL